MNIVAKPKILLIDDDELILESFQSCFESLGYEADCESNPEKALERIKSNEYDLIFLDLKMEPIDGYFVLSEIKKTNPFTTVIIISGFGEFDDAIEAVEKGAYHIIKKPIDFKDLQFFTKKAWEFHLIKTELRKLKQELGEKSVHSNKFITKNPELLKTLELLKEIAQSDIPVLLRGESGTGKELLAEMIHEASHRREYPLIKINFASIPEDFLESELFGYTQGVFPEATQDKLGKLELADGGTIFLDGIGEISTSFQAKLLQVLQTKEFEPLGQFKTKKIDVRIISAININIEEAIKEKSFREDLYYSLKGVEFEIPPLRDRVEDIPLLVEFFIQKFKNPDLDVKISQEAMQLLKTYRWSGNVRELQNVIHRAVVLTKNGLITSKQLPLEIQNRNIHNEELVSLEELEKTHIKKVLQKTSDYKEASRILGIDLTTLWRKRKKYQID